MKSWSFFIDTYGCKINQYETQKIREAWLDNGGTETEKPQDAEYILVNSCAITSRAERDARNAINRFRAAAPDAKIILTGCAAQFYNSFIPYKKAAHQKPDYCITQQDKSCLLAGPPALTGAHTKKGQLSAYYRSRPVIKIQDGCSQKCAYCIVPQTRGRSVSRSGQSILEECRNFARAGYGELILSGINLRQYFAGGNFWFLVRYLEQNLKQEFGKQLRLRLSSLDPAMLTGEGIQTISSATMLCPQLHLSIQHASQPILINMNRTHYTAESIISAVCQLQKDWSVMGLGADFITGFPGEGDEDFQELLNFIKALPLTYAHVFPYSRRQGTPAAIMPGQIPNALKTARAKILRDTINAKKFSFWQQQLKLERMQIIAEPLEIASKTSMHGVNEYYVPCFLKKPYSGKGLITVRPLATGSRGLEVEIM